MKRKNPGPIAPHRALLLLCARARPDGTTQRRIRALVEAGVEWPRLLVAAERHALTPLAASALRKVPLDRVPEPIRAALGRARTVNAARNRLVAQDLLSLARRFAEQRVPWVPLKGVLLAEAVYGDLGLRQAGDLDLLIRPRDLAPAVRLAQACGFRLQDPSSQGPSDVERHRDVTLLRVGPMPYPLELHWRFKDTFFRLPVEALWASLVDYRWRGAELRILSPELTLIHLTHHLTYHAFPLKILVDVAEALRAFEPELDWDAVLARASEWRMARSLAAALEAARTLLGAPVPERVLAELRRRIGRRRWAEALVGRASWHFGRRAVRIQSDADLRSLFSVLFLDGSYGSSLRAVLERGLSGAAAPPSEDTAGRAISASRRVPRKARRARRVVRLLAGLWGLLGPHPPTT